MSQPNDQINQHLLIALKAAELLKNPPEGMPEGTVTALKYIYGSHITTAHTLTRGPVMPLLTPSEALRNTTGNASHYITDGF